MRRAILTFVSEKNPRRFVVASAIGLNQSKLRLRRVTKLLIAISLAGFLATGAVAGGTVPTDPPGTIAGAFTKRSYAPGAEATFVLTHRVERASLGFVPASKLTGPIYVSSSGRLDGSRLRLH